MEAILSPTSASICSATSRNKVPRRQHSKQLWALFALVALIVQVASVTASTGIKFGTASSSRIPTFAVKKNKLAFDVARSFPRGGSALFGDAVDEDEEDEEDEEEKDENDIRQHPDFDALQAYRMKQQVLLQLRATYLGEALAKRGLPIPTLSDVQTPDGKAPPKKVDWDCAMSTRSDPKHCLISYEPEPGSKLVVPTEMVSTDKWITLTELNRLRRNDPSKVNPMWSDRYAILSSWFSPDSRYSLLQHVGPKGVVLSTILDGSRLPLLVFLGLVVAVVQLLPIIEILANRFLVSSFLWTKWLNWYRYVHVGLPMKLLILQIVYSYLAKGFVALVSFIKVKLVDLECKILEETIPLTVGEGSERPVEDSSEDLDDEDDEDEDEDLFSESEDESDDDE